MVKHPSNRAERMALKKLKENEKKKASHVRQHYKEVVQEQETWDELREYTQG